LTKSKTGRNPRNGRYDNVVEEQKIDEVDEELDGSTVKPKKEAADDKVP